jgi:hypothetical protein
MADEDHISEHDFLLEFFGDLGRELGDPDQFYVDNPMVIFDFIEKCRVDKKPAFMSIEPRFGHNRVLGIESIFFDFDYGKKSDNLTPEQIVVKSKELEVEVLEFIKYVCDVKRYNPMIVKTNKGYHVSIYFDKVYQLPSFKQWSKATQPYWKLVYRLLQEDIIAGFRNHTKHDINYIDESVIGRIEGLKRIPFSIHQKSGEKCPIVNRNLQPDKIRAMAFFKNVGLKRPELDRAMSEAERILIEKEERKIIIAQAHREQRELEHGFIGKIRPCFLKSAASKEMPHQMRLAYLKEMWFSGIKTFVGLAEPFKNMNDYIEEKTNYQVQYFLDHIDTDPYPPYTCDKMRELKWCLESPECERWQRIYGKTEPKKE